jgi:hypothetical protein
MIYQGSATDGISSKHTTLNPPPAPKVQKTKVTSVPQKKVVKIKEEKPPVKPAKIPNSGPKP